MTEVFLHVYDVVNSDSVRTNNAIIQFNKVFKDGIGLGGIFHSAVEVYGKEEWSFGFCELGTGVFSCSATKNPMYLYRESVSLGYTSLNPLKVNEVLRELKMKWQGYSYDLLSKNCNHFCNEFCERLGVQRLPGWVNRFANAGETALEVAETTAKHLRQAKMEVVSASKAAYRVLFGGSPSTSTTSMDSDVPAGNDNPSNNILRLPFLKTPINLFSRINSSGRLESTSDDNTTDVKEGKGAPNLS